MTVKSIIINSASTNTVVQRVSVHNRYTCSQNNPGTINSLYFRPRVEKPGNPIMNVDSLWVYSLLQKRFLLVLGLKENDSELTVLVKNNANGPSIQKPQKHVLISKCAQSWELQKTKNRPNQLKISVLCSHFSQEIDISAFDSSKNRGGLVDHFDIHIIGAAVF